MGEMNELIEIFLKDHREYPEDVTDNDIAVLYNIIYVLIEYKFTHSLDGEGRAPIEVRLIDRTKYQAFHYREVPYDFNVGTPELAEEILDARIQNLEVAMKDMQQHLSMVRYMRKKHS